MDFQKNDRVRHCSLPDIPYTVVKAVKKTDTLILRSAQGEDFASSFSKLAPSLQAYPQKGDRVVLLTAPYLRYITQQLGQERRLREEQGKAYRRWKTLNELEEQEHELMFLKPPKWSAEIFEVRKIIDGDRAFIKKPGVLETSLPAWCFAVYERPRAADTKANRHLQAVEPDRTWKAS